MTHKFKLIILLTFLMISRNAAAVKPLDSLRVKTVLKEVKILSVFVRDSILPDLKEDEKKKIKELVSQLNKHIKKSEKEIKDTMTADFGRLSSEDKSIFTEMEETVKQIKHTLPEKSVNYHHVAFLHKDLYKAVQEMRTDGRTPLLETYLEPYDPSTTTNNQVIMVGAYLNFYLEYRISVGGIEMGPDIVDPDRLVFTFPEKLLVDLSTPTFIEVKASPQKQIVVNGNSKFENHVEQTAYLLVYPKKK